ncbi:MAG: hypothetical protein AAGF83_19445 [Cyanobacteria bacterium P01_G01_bin.67]
MSKNRMVWLVLEASFYLLIVFLILDFINLMIEGVRENSEIKQNVLCQLEQEAEQQKI